MNIWNLPSGIATAITTDQIQRIPFPKNKQTSMNISTISLSLIKIYNSEEVSAKEKSKDRIIERNNHFHTIEIDINVLI